MSITAIGTFDAIVVGGGPAGATAAHDLAKAGHSVLLLDRAGRIKPCGGAIPPRLIADFEIPAHLLVARATSARMVSPADKKVDIPIENGFDGMVDRERFDEWLRERAAEAGVLRQTGRFEKIERDDDGMAIVHWRSEGEEGAQPVHSHARARCIIGADGAKSGVARAEIDGWDRQVRFRVPRDRAQARGAARGLRRLALRRHLPRHAVARLLRLGVPARRHAVDRHRQRRQGLLTASRHGHTAPGVRPGQRADRAPRRRTDPDEAAAALGQRPRCRARR